MPHIILDVDASTLRAIREVQEQEGGSVGATVSRLLSEALLARHRLPARPAPFEWRARPMQPKMDLSDQDVVYAALDRAHQQRPGTKDEPPR